MRWKPNFAAGPMLIASGLIALLSTGCTPAAHNRAGVLPRALPPPPDWAQPVAVLRPPDGTDWEIVARREQQGREAANGRLVRMVDWYEERRADLARQ